MPRTPGLRGRQPVKPAGEKFALRWLHEYATGGALPAPTYPVDVSGGITEWGLLGNDQYGDCTFAGREHYRMAKAAAAGETETWETSDDLVAEYLKYDHGRDEGANIADLLLYWYKSGKILAFAPVDHTDPAQVDAAMQAFHGVYAGVNLTDDADDRFNNGQAWTVASGQQPDPSEGHCIVKVGAQGVAGGHDVWVTWGALQPSTAGWTAACLDEAWVVITSEDEAAKVDMEALLADIEALHGTGGRPAPAPSPGPAPSPSSLLHELAAKVRECAANPDRDLAEVIAWMGSVGI